MIDNWANNHLISGSNYNIVDLYCQKNYKEWQRMLGQHLVLVTLYGQFTISIEQVK